jgi:hypothetical protein
MSVPTAILGRDRSFGAGIGAIRSVFGASRPDGGCLARDRHTSSSLVFVLNRRQRPRCRRVPFDPRSALRAQIGLFGEGGSWVSPVMGARLLGADTVPDVGELSLYGSASMSTTRGKSDDFYGSSFSRPWSTSAFGSTSITSLRLHPTTLVR